MKDDLILKIIEKFFRVSIDEIKSELKRLKDDLNIDSEIHLTLLAEAKEYRLSEARRNHLEAALLVLREATFALLSLLLFAFG